MIFGFLPALSSFWFVGTQHMDEGCSPRWEDTYWKTGPLRSGEQVTTVLPIKPAKSAWEVGNVGPFPKSQPSRMQRK